MFKFVLHFLFLVVGIAYLVRRSERFYWAAFAVFIAGFVANAVYGIVQLGSAEVLGINLDQSVLSPITGGASQINIYGAIGGESVFRPNALTGDPNHLGIELVIPLLVLTPLYLRLEKGHRLKVPLALVLAFLLLVELATLSRSGLLGLGAGLLVLAVPYRRKLLTPEFLLPLGAVAAVLALVLAARWDFFEQVLRTRIDTSANGTSTHFDVYGFIPDVLSSHPLFGLGLNNFSVYYEFVTGRTNFGPHSFYVATLVETGRRRHGAVRRLPRLHLQAPEAVARDRADARVAADSPARVGDDRGARRDDRLERLLPDDVVLLLLRVRDARARGADRLRPPPPVKVVVLTTSYPRHERDVAGLFVRDAVEAVRAEGVEVEVVSPASFPHFGIAYGHGIVGNLRRRPWLALLLPAFLVSLRAGGAAGRAGCGSRPRALAPVRLRRACDRQAVRRPALGNRCRDRAAGALALPADPAPGAAGDRGVAVPRGRRARARRARGAHDPERGRDPRDGRRAGGAAARALRRPPFAGEGDPRVPVGHGGPAAGDRRSGADTVFPRRSASCRTRELGPYYERAAVVCVPSRREGYGFVAHEAMAYGRPVVATAVGGLVDAIEDDVTGKLVARGDARALAKALQDLIADGDTRRRLGRAARAVRQRRSSLQPSSPES